MAPALVGYLDFYGATVAVEATDLTWRRIIDPRSSVVGRAAGWNGALVGFAICAFATRVRIDEKVLEVAHRRRAPGRLVDHARVPIEPCPAAAPAKLDQIADNARARRLYDAYVEADDFVRRQSPARRYRIRF